MIASAPIETQTKFLERLGPAALRALPFLFEFWAHSHQLPPGGDWRTWVILGGRGAGKTRAGAEWVRSQVEGARPNTTGRLRRIALVGETIDQVREVMIFGDSGLLACSPPDRRPEWEATRKMLVWQNGAVAQAFSAHDPESLRGPQFDGAWVDELAKWKRAEATWDMLQFGLRLGRSPRQCVTTTPRNVEILKRILASPSTVMTHARTEVNRAHLAQSFLEEVRARYSGTFLARQELDGVLLDDVEDALWTRELLETAHIADAVPPLSRTVVAIDPPVTGHAASNACGIVVAGVDTRGPVGEWCAYVLEDATITGVSPTEWAKTAVEAFHRHQADRLVAEVNQGGDLVETLLRQVDPLVPYRSVRATRGKLARAEPVSALYEQGRVKHAAGLDALEDQMRRFGRGGYQGSGSPDRVDALVWAIHDLMIEAMTSWRRPKVRSLV